MKVIILDSGHGGMLGDDYQTWPNKLGTFNHNPAPGSPLIHERDGKFYFYEGEFNRLIVSKVKEYLRDINVPFIETSHLYHDTPLESRVTIERTLSQYSDSLFISSHANWSSVNSANGVEVFTSKGDTFSDVAATYYIGLLDTILEQHSVGMKFRLDYFTDGDPDKEANFYVLRESLSSAILIEHGFMSNEKDVQHMCNPVVQDIFAKAQALTAVWFYHKKDDVEEASFNLLSKPPKCRSKDKQP